MNDRAPPRGSHVPHVPLMLAVALLLASPTGAPARAAADTPPPPAAAPGATSPTAEPSLTADASPTTAAAGTPSAAAAAAEDIRDIRGPKYGVPLWVIAAALGGLALLALAAYGIWRWRRSRRRPRVLLPFEQALQQLEGIRPLMQPASAREFSIAVSDIVRGYIEQRFDVTATHLTTEEFMQDLVQTPKPALARHRGLLTGFLQQCDLVKFGGMSLSLHTIESLHDSARGFVLETAKPDPVVPQIPKEAHDTLSAT